MLVVKLEGDYILLHLGTHDEKLGNDTILVFDFHFEIRDREMPFGKQNDRKELG